ncbi:MAG: sulfotransferase family protein [Streptosporangiaceae bacterium]
MRWDARVNATLRRVGYQVTRPPGHPSRKMAPPEGRRLLTAPIIVLSPARAGSTLLRMILDSHSALHAPPELPLTQLTVRAETTWIRASLKELQLSTQEVTYLLWDRVLADVVSRSGKPTVVIKTPSNVLIWREIAECWPDARFIFLLRHPAGVVASLNHAWNQDWHPRESGSLAESAAKAARYMTSLEEARHALAGHTIRYEDLTADPAAQARRLCEFLGVPFELAMLEYGRFGHGRIGAGLGDASVKLRSGRIQPATLPPLSLGTGSTGFPETLLKLCATWGYSVPEESDFAGPRVGRPRPSMEIPAARGGHHAKPL